MKIQTFASGSKGNLHLVEIADKKILIEAGLPISKIMEHLEYDINIDACLISHYHKDHAKSAGKLMQAAIDVYCSDGTADKIDHSCYRLKRVKERFKIGDIDVFTFRTDHDTEGSIGFLISHGSERLMFATDTGNMPYKFPGMTHVMIECNYSEERIKDLEPKEIGRVRKTHMGLEDCKRFLNSNDLSKLKELHLVHLSDRNSDPELFKKECQKICGVPVFIS